MRFFLLYCSFFYVHFFCPPHCHRFLYPCGSVSSMFMHVFTLHPPSAVFFFSNYFFMLYWMTQQKKKLFCPFLCCNSIRCHMKRHEKILFSRSTNFFYEWTHYSMFNDSLELVQDFIFWQIMKIKILRISCWIFVWKFFSFWGWICYDENTRIVVILMNMEKIFLLIENKFV